MSNIHEKLAKILRTKPEVLLDLEQKLSTLTGKFGVMDKIVEENEVLVRRTLNELGLAPDQRNAKSVYNVLVERLKHMDSDLFNFLDKPDLAKMSVVCGKLCEMATMVNQPQSGFFIKKEKAISMLEKFPPQNILNFFGYQTVRELVEKENFSSVFSALRFAQDQKWMHEFFDQAYDDLTVDDFEERDIELKVLETKWLNVAEKFLEKKYHNLSHLKEFGVIFVIPLPIDTEGETIRLFTLMLHYLNEVPFYSKLFRKFSREPDFPSKLKSLLRGDVLEGQLPVASGPDRKAIEDPRQSRDQSPVRIVQRYLAKDDEYDFRLAEPHINPEAEHWYKAVKDLGGIAVSSIASFAKEAQSLDFVGDFFQQADGTEELVSFDLIDLVMSLVQKGEIKYLYHQQEALWNKIFIEYLGRDKIAELVEENIIKGYIEL